MPKRWTKEEHVILARLYAAGLPRREIAVRLRRSEDAVDARRRGLGIRARSRSRSWSPAEDAFIRAATVAGIPAPELAARLRWPPEAVRRRRRALGLSLASSRRYGAAEDAALRTAWQGDGDIDTLAAALGRSRESLRLRARALGLSHPRPRRRWKAIDDRLLREGYARGLTCAAISDRLLPGRSTGAIAARARKLGLATYARLWSPAEDRRLAELAETGTPLEDAATELIRTPEAVRRRARVLGLPQLPPLAHANAHRRWRRDEDALLRRHASTDPSSLARLLGRSDHAVRRRLVTLGLRHGRTRSPHHALPASAELTPGERRLLIRELEDGSPRRLLSLSRRLGRTPGALKRTAAEPESGARA